MYSEGPRKAVEKVSVFRLSGFSGFFGLRRFDQDLLSVRIDKGEFPAGKFGDADCFIYASPIKPNNFFM